MQIVKIVLALFVILAFLVGVMNVVFRMISATENRSKRFVLATFIALSFIFCILFSPISWQWLLLESKLARQLFLAAWVIPSSVYGIMMAFQTGRDISKRKL